MKIPTSFTFSQSRLQDYFDCPRKFLLRYIRKLKWPALESEPVIERERQMQAGQLFHQLVHQYLLGMEMDMLSRVARGPMLEGWWQNFLDSGVLSELPAAKDAEYVLSAPFAGYRLVAKYDLVAVEPGGRAVIMDWKTGPYRPSDRKLSERIQTRLYTLLLCQAGIGLNGGKPIPPEQIEMIYWFSEHPENPCRILYSREQYEADRRFLTDLIQQILLLEEGQFHPTANQKLCEICPYRSFCERGIQAGEWPGDEDLESEANLADLDLSQIGEIEF